MRSGVTYINNTLIIFSVCSLLAWRFIAFPEATSVLKIITHGLRWAVAGLGLIQTKPGVAAKPPALPSSLWRCRTQGLLKNKAAQKKTVKQINCLINAINVRLWLQIINAGNQTCWSTEWLFNPFTLNFAVKWNYKSVPQESCEAAVTTPFGQSFLHI